MSATRTSSRALARFRMFRTVSRSAATQAAIVLSGLGTDTAGILSAGAKALVAANPRLSDGEESLTRRTVGLDAAPPFDFATNVSRETVAAAMLDEAEMPRFAGAIALPLDS
ncbi:hypothetical protein ACIA49_32875 [Kribbella sp. NPDC051587]|uniref:hypothetical protein n=1 Tax=Kribbella sp. NPDC051587 TaxID=3364119 RepID=UPI00378ADFAC